MVPRLSPLLEREMEKKTLVENGALLSAELRACERVLGCVIEGVGPDQLLIRYSLKSGEDSIREVSFVLDVSSTSYKGVSCHPCPLDARANDS